MHDALHRTGLSAAGKMWDDNDFVSMKMDEYCKDLEMQVGNFDKPIWLTRIVRLWHERWYVPKRPGGRHQQLMAHMEKKYVGLFMDEMENDWKIYRINRVEMTGWHQKHSELRGVTMKYNDTKPKNHPDNRDEHEYWVLNDETLECIVE